MPALAPVESPPDGDASEDEVAFDVEFDVEASRVPDGNDDESVEVVEAAPVLLPEESEVRAGLAGFVDDAGSTPTGEAVVGGNVSCVDCVDTPTPGSGTEVVVWAVLVSLQPWSWLIDQNGHTHGDIGVCPKDGRVSHCAHHHLLGRDGGNDGVGLKDNLWSDRRAGAGGQDRDGGDSAIDGGDDRRLGGSSGGSRRLCRRHHRIDGQ